MRTIPIRRIFALVFRFLHTADLHLDSPLRSLAMRDEAIAERVGSASRAALRRIVDAALDRNANALLIAGDLFDGRVQSMKTAAFLTHQMERLAAADVRVFMIRGNHDAESVLTRELRLPPNVHTFSGKGGTVKLEEAGVAVHGVSFAKPHAPESLLPKYNAPVPGMFNIGLLHSSLAGAEGHDVYAPCALSDLKAHGYDYWALGHVHSRQVHWESPHIVMPGMPQGRDIGESGPKSATLVTVENGGVTLEEVPTASVIFLDEPLDLRGQDDWRGARQHIVDRMRDRTAAHECFCLFRLRLAGDGDLIWRLRRDRDQLLAELREDAEADGTYGIEKLSVSLPPPNTSQPTDAQNTTSLTARDELIRLMAEVSATPGFEEKAAGILADVVGDLPQELRNEFGSGLEAQQAQAKALLLEGLSEVTARLMTTQSPEGEA